MSLLFESLFDAAFDHVRGFGGKADIPFFKHGTHWFEQNIQFGLVCVKLTYRLHAVRFIGLEGVSKYCGLENMIVSLG